MPELFGADISHIVQLGSQPDGANLFNKNSVGHLLATALRAQMMSELAGTQSSCSRKPVDPQLASFAKSESEGGLREFLATRTTSLAGLNSGTVSANPQGRAEADKPISIENQEQPRKQKLRIR